jgi:hypothetical protein
MRLLLIPVFLFLCISFSNSQSVEFYKEELKFSIENNWFYVSGTYYFRNLTGDTIQRFLIYPLPDEKEFGVTDSIKITPLEKNDPAGKLKRVNPNRASFTIFILPRGTAAYKIDYRQQIQANKMKYILTSMRTWHNNLERADFELTYPVNLCIGFINFLPDTVMLLDGNIIWRWSKSNFMPDRDVDIILRK